MSSEQEMRAANNSGDPKFIPLHELCFRSSGQTRSGVVQLVDVDIHDRHCTCSPSAERPGQERLQTHDDMNVDSN